MKARNIVGAVILVIFTIATAGCGHAEIYGEKISSKNMTAIKEIVAKPKDHDGKTVIVRGKIITECPTGCWFNLEEDGAVLYVDIKPSGLAIPQKVGSKATVEGEIRTENNRTILVGKGVDVR